MDIAADAARHAGAIADAISAAFAIRMDDARRSLPAHERAAALRALANARDAALASAAETASLEVRGRRQAAIAGHLMQDPKERRGTYRRSTAAKTRRAGRIADAEPESRTDKESRAILRADARRSFKHAARAVTRSAARPARRTRGDSNGTAQLTYRRASRRVVQRRMMIDRPTADRAVLFLVDTLDWLDLWQAGDLEYGDSGNVLDANTKCLFPGPEVW